MFGGVFRSGSRKFLGKEFLRKSLLRKGVLEVCRPSLNLKISFSDDYIRNLISVWFILRI